MTAKNRHTPTPTASEKRDDLIGRRLSKQMDAEAASICPSVEEIASLVEGSAKGETRDLLMGHLAGCGKCFEVFTTARELLDTQHHTTRSRFLTPLSISLAAAAVLAIGVTITLQTHSPEKAVIAKTQNMVTPPAQPRNVAPHSPVADATTPIANTHQSAVSQAEDMARKLVLNDNDRQLASAFHSAGLQVLGFSGALSANKVAFRLGVQTLDLEVLLRLDDREGVLTRLHQIIELLGLGEDGQKSVSGRFEKIKTEIEAGVSLQKFSGCTASIDAQFSGNSEGDAYRFGQWAERGRLSALSGNAKLLSAQETVDLQRSVKGMELPVGVQSAMGDIVVTLQLHEMTEKEYARLRRSFENILALF